MNCKKLYLNYTQRFNCLKKNFCLFKKSSKVSKTIEPTNVHELRTPESVSEVKASKNPVSTQRFSIRIFTSKRISPECNLNDSLHKRHLNDRIHENDIQGNIYVATITLKNAIDINNIAIKLVDIMNNVLIYTRQCKEEFKNVKKVKQIIETNIKVEYIEHEESLQNDKTIKTNFNNQKIKTMYMNAIIHFYESIEHAQKIISKVVIQTKIANNFVLHFLKDIEHYKREPIIESEKNIIKNKTYPSILKYINLKNAIEMAQIDAQTITFDDFPDVIIIATLKAVNATIKFRHLSRILVSTSSLFLHDIAKETLIASQTLNETTSRIINYQVEKALARVRYLGYYSYFTTNTIDETRNPNSSKVMNDIYIEASNIFDAFDEMQLLIGYLNALIKSFNSIYGNVDIKP